jgi:hypothetical protein
VLKVKLNKLNNCLRITGIINSAFRPNKTRIKLYNTLSLPTLLYDNENLTIKARGAITITAAEMKYVRRTAGYTLTDHKPNRDYKKIKYNPSFRQNTGLQEKLDTTCKSNAT